MKKDIGSVLALCPLSAVVVGALATQAKRKASVVIMMETRENA